MSNDEATQPPVKQPNTPRVWIAKARKFSAEHPDLMLLAVFALMVMAGIAAVL